MSRFSCFSPKLSLKAADYLHIQVVKLNTPPRGTRTDPNRPLTSETPADICLPGRLSADHASSPLIHGRHIFELF